ncbi:response regulator transcription factor [Vallitalea sp.]|uniref:response regulator transcription factor n=1 Tax=Vallitalea sp. TaxID=1882829 RepID=UPI0025D5A0BD|nr:response regulator [Vallitalea sp.]MCT4687220.1 response regulator [Vallitalea sp.]
MSTILRILLVDDENIVLKGMQHVLSKLDDVCKVVGVANGGKIALEMIERLAPDVIITDVKMPDIDGIELTKTIMAKKPNTYIIILSGHADFQFARDALRYGAYDYLLKPCKFKEITSILKKINIELGVKKNSNRNQKELKDKLEYSKRENIKGKILNYLLNDQFTDNIEINISRVRVITYRYNDYYINKDNINEILKKLLLDKLNSNHIIEMLEYNNQVILIIDETCDLNVFIKLLSMVKLELTKKGSWICGGISNIYYSLDGLKEAYEESYSIMEFLLFNEIYEINQKSEIDSKYSNCISSFKDSIIEEDKIIKMLFIGNINNLEQYLNQVIKKLLSNNKVYIPHEFKSRIKKLMIIVEKKLTQNDIEIASIFNRTVECIYEIERINSYKQLFNWVKNMLLTISSYIEEKKNQYPKPIQEAIKYIESNYNKDISMKLMADIVFLNPCYFSELFKETIGVPFSDYITQLRINKAKELLSTTHFTNYQIAEKVGFKNATYFNVVFKKNEGLTPKNYRKLLG